MSIHRRHFLSQVAAAAGAYAAFPSLAQAQEAWPQRPVRVLSPYGAGGSNDISARILCEELGKRLHQQFIVENKPGAGTRLANEFVARSAPDGYTWLYAAAPFATAEPMYGKLSYDPVRDFKPVTLAVIAPIFLIVNASTPFKTVADLVAYGKAKPEGLTFATPGSGSGPHLTTELFFKEAGVQGLNVHFRGDATAYTELLAGRVDATLTAMPTALPHVQAGKLRVLAVGSEERSPVYPGVPTFREQGFPKVVGYGWFGFMAPAATPAVVVDRMSKEVNAILKEPAVSKRLIELGAQPQGGTPAEFASFIAQETRKWGEVIKTADVKPE
jgi:tripartite-type tricarboxylate transporter receptor subunit TctC